MLAFFGGGTIVALLFYAIFVVAAAIGLFWLFVAGGAIALVLWLLIALFKA